MSGSSNALLRNDAGSAISGNECLGLPGNVTSLGLNVAWFSIKMPSEFRGPLPLALYRQNWYAEKAEKKNGHAERRNRYV